MIPARREEPPDAVVLLPISGASIASFVACTTFAPTLGLSITQMVLLSSASFAVYAAALWRASKPSGTTHTQSKKLSI